MIDVNIANKMMHEAESKIDSAAFMKMVENLILESAKNGQDSLAKAFTVKDLKEFFKVDDECLVDLAVRKCEKDLIDAGFKAQFKFRCVLQEYDSKSYVLNLCWDDQAMNNRKLQKDLDSNII